MDDQSNDGDTSTAQQMLSFFESIVEYLPTSDFDNLTLVERRELQDTLLILNGVDVGPNESLWKALNRYYPSSSPPQSFFETVDTKDNHEYSNYVIEASLEESISGQKRPLLTPEDLHIDESMNISNAIPQISMLKETQEDEPDAKRCRVDSIDFQENNIDSETKYTTEEDQLRQQSPDQLPEALQSTSQSASLSVPVEESQLKSSLPPKSILKTHTTARKARVMFKDTVTLVTQSYDLVQGDNSYYHLNQIEENINRLSYENKDTPTQPSSDRTRRHINFENVHEDQTSHVIHNTDNNSNIDSAVVYDSSPYQFPSYTQTQSITPTSTYQSYDDLVDKSMNSTASVSGVVSHNFGDDYASNNSNSSTVIKKVLFPSEEQLAYTAVSDSNVLSSPVNNDTTTSGAMIVDVSSSDGCELSFHGDIAATKNDVYNVPPMMAFYSQDLVPSDSPPETLRYDDNVTTIDNSYHNNNDFTVSSMKDDVINTNAGESNANSNDYSDNDYSNNDHINSNHNDNESTSTGTANSDDKDPLKLSSWPAVIWTRTHAHLPAPHLIRTDANGVIVYWVEKNLRFEDNLALQSAMVASQMLNLPLIALALIERDTIDDITTSNSVPEELFVVDTHSSDPYHASSSAQQYSKLVTPAASHRYVNNTYIRAHEEEGTSSTTTKNNTHHPVTPATASAAATADTNTNTNINTAAAKEMSAREALRRKSFARMQGLLGLQESLAAIDVPLLIYDYPAVLDSDVHFIAQNLNHSTDDNNTSNMSTTTHLTDYIQSLHQQYPCLTAPHNNNNALSPKALALLQLLSPSSPLLKSSSSPSSSSSLSQYLSVLITDDYSHPLQRHLLATLTQTHPELPTFCVDSSSTLPTAPNLPFASSVSASSASALSQRWKYISDWTISRENFHAKIQQRQQALQEAWCMREQEETLLQAFIMENNNDTTTTNNMNNNNMNNNIYDSSTNHLSKYSVLMSLNEWQLVENDLVHDKNSTHNSNHYSNNSELLATKTFKWTLSAQRRLQQQYLTNCDSTNGLATGLASAENALREIPWNIMYSAMNSTTADGNAINKGDSSCKYNNNDNNNDKNKLVMNVTPTHHTNYSSTSTTNDNYSDSKSDFQDFNSPSSHYIFSHQTVTKRWLKLTSYFTHNNNNNNNNFPIFLENEFSAVSYFHAAYQLGLLSPMHILLLRILLATNHDPTDTTDNKDKTLFQHVKLLAQQVVTACLDEEYAHLVLHDSRTLHCQVSTVKSKSTRNLNSNNNNNNSKMGRVVISTNITWMQSLPLETLAFLFFDPSSSTTSSATYSTNNMVYLQQLRAIWRQNDPDQYPFHSVWSTNTTTADNPNNQSVAVYRDRHTLLFWLLSTLLCAPSVSVGINLLFRDYILYHTMAGTDGQWSSVSVFLLACMELPRIVQQLVSHEPLLLSREGVETLCLVTGSITRSGTDNNNKKHNHRTNNDEDNHVNSSDHPIMGIVEQLLLSVVQ